MDRAIVFLLSGGRSMGEIYIYTYIQIYIHIYIYTHTCIYLIFSLSLTLGTMKGTTVLMECSKDQRETTVWQKHNCSI